MANVLSDTKRQQVLALGQLRWPLRRIEEATGVRRETASAYLKAAGVPVRPPRRWGHGPPKPAKEPLTDPGAGADSAKGALTDSGTCFHDERKTDALAWPRSDATGVGCTSSTPDFRTAGESGPVPAWPRSPGRSPQASACEPYREVIELGLSRGRNAVAIWQDLVDDHGFTGHYHSVQRFVRKLRGSPSREAHPVIVTPAGQEGQVDYGEGPMVRYPETGKYRRTRLFVFTLGYSRKSVRLLAFRSSSRIWAELHERAFRRIGGAPRVIILDNLKEGVLKPDIYDPELNPLYRDVLEHYGVTGIPCRVRDADRKGKVESGVGHAQRTPLKGLRFESLDEGQAYLDRWEERWADTRIHGTTKRQVAAMFAEERPHLLPLPLEPFRYYQYGTRTVHLDGCVEVEGAYYAPPLGSVGAEVHVQWDGRVVRILDPKTGQLLREHLRQEPGRHRIREEDRPSRTPKTTEQLLARADLAGKHIGPLCRRIHGNDGEPGVRRILGVLSLAKKYGAAAVDHACDAALEMGVPTYRFVRRYLERPPGAAHPAPGRPAHPAAHPLPRPHRSQDQGDPMNPVEIDRALRQLRLSGMADALQARLLQAQSEKMPPLDFLSVLVQDELKRRQDRLIERRIKQAAFRDRGKTLDAFDFDFNKKMDRRLVYELATGRFIGHREDAVFLGPPGTGKSHLAQAIGHAAIQQGYKVLYREAYTLIEEIADATLDGTRKDCFAALASVPLLIVDDLGMRKLPATAAEDLLEVIMRRYERASTIIASNRPVDDWGKLLGDTAPVSALLDRVLHHAHVLKCGPRSWRMKQHVDDLREEEAVR